MNENLLIKPFNVEIIEREEDIILPEINYIPLIQDAKPQVDPKKFRFEGDRLYKVVDIIDEETLQVDTGLFVKFLGVKIIRKEETLKYLENYLLGKNIILKFDPNFIEEDYVKAYVYLKNKIFINAYLIKSGLGVPDITIQHKYKEKFINLWREIENAKRMDIKYGNK